MVLEPQYAIFHPKYVINAWRHGKNAYPTATTLIKYKYFGYKAMMLMPRNSLYVCLVDLERIDTCSI